jgi:hypothetical protein
VLAIVTATPTGQYHVVDTGVVLPRPGGPPGTAAPGVQVRPYADRRYTLVDWVNLDLAPYQTPMGERDPSQEGTPRATVEWNTRLDYDLLERIRLAKIMFRQVHRIYLTNDQLRKVIDAISHVTFNNLELQLAFFRYYTGLVTPHLHVEGEDLADTSDVTRNTRIGRDAFNYSLPQLGGVLLHEFTHQRTERTGSSGSSPPDEGKAHGVEFFFAERDHVQITMDRVRQVYLDGGGYGFYESQLADLFRPRFHQAYAVMAVLYAVIENATGPVADAPFMRPRPMSHDTARRLVAEYMATVEYRGQLQQVVEWAESNPTALHVPRFSRR